MQIVAFILNYVTYIHDKKFNPNDAETRILWYG